MATLLLFLLAFALVYTWLLRSSSQMGRWS